MLQERICRVKPRVHVFGHYHLGRGAEGSNVTGLSQSEVVGTSEQVGKSIMFGGRMEDG